MSGIGFLIGIYSLLLGGIDFTLVLAELAAFLANSHMHCSIVIGVAFSRGDSSSESINQGLPSSLFRPVHTAS